MKTFLAVKRKANIRYSNFIFFYLIAATATAVGMVVMNRLSGDMNAAAYEGDTSALLHFFLLMTALLVVRAAAAAATTLITARATANTGYKLRTVFVRHFLHVPFGKLEQKASGEYLSVYSNDIPQTERLMASGLLDVIASVISFISAIVFLLVISPQITGIVFLAAIVMVVIIALLNLPMASAQKRMSEEQAKFNAVVNDSLQNLSVVAAYSLGDVLEERYMTAYNKFFVELKRFAKFLAVSIGGMFTVMLGPLIVMLIFLAMRTLDGYFSLSDFIAFALTVVIVATGMMSLGQSIGGFVSATGRAKRLLEETADPHENLKDGYMPNIAPATISFKNVAFTYEATGEEEPAEKQDEKPKKKGGMKISFGPPPAAEEPVEKKEPTPPVMALDGTTFEIAPGSKVAIVGGSGSGKSTVLKLLLGLYEPQSGEIAIGGKDTSTFAKNGLRNMFAYVPQDSFLFPESIGKNITGEDEITDLPRLEKACADAGILDFINTLPNRFGGVLTEAADNVSGGQRQRIAMARAFYKNAPVILFDEATSSLDPITEAAVLDSFNCATSDKTVIIVAHRATAIAGCETVIVMDAGRVANIGTHESLLANCSIYQSLYAPKESDPQ